MSEQLPVSISVFQNPYIGYNVFDARDYQKDAYYRFMETNNEKMTFRYDEGRIVFTMKKFDDSGFEGDYSSFCCLVNDKDEEHILSNNAHLLNGFTGFRNRMTCR